MKVTINNFGPIDTITFDLDKEFHLIYGKNSIGKSYSTYCLYCLIKNVKGKSLPYWHYWHNDKERETFIEQVKSIFKKNKSDEARSSELESFASEYLHSKIQRQIIPGLGTSLLNTFSSLQVLKNAYTKQNYSIVLETEDDFVVTINSDDEGAPFLDTIDLQNRWTFVQKKTISTKFTYLVDNKKGIGTPTEEKFIREFLEFLDAKIRKIYISLNSNIRDVYYLPASRSGLYQALSSFTPILAELTQNRFFLSSKKIELPSLSEPLSDYFIDISTIDSSTVNKQFSTIINDFEQNILEGSVRYDSETKKIKYKPFDIHFELDIAEVSSMVAELSPIVIFLKHILHHKYTASNTQDSSYFYVDYSSMGRNKGKKDIIFIEEPEAHLHPEVQVKLTEIFAELTKHNINIVMTSHSNYMFNKTNNIILQKKLSPNALEVYQLIKGEKGSYCNPYMKIDEDGISDENFVEVSKKLYHERLDSMED